MIPLSRFYESNRTFSEQEIAEVIGAKILSSNGTDKIKNISSLKGAEKEDLIFVWDKKIVPHLAHTKATHVVTSPTLSPSIPDIFSVFVVDSPHKAYHDLAHYLYPHFKASPSFEKREPQAFRDALIHPTAFIHPGTKIGAGTIIEAGVVLGPDVVIGEKCHLYPHASLSHTHLGNRVTIYPGARIGQAGFGFIPTPQGPLDLPHMGRVIIQDDVRIGANTCVDRGLVDNTLIERGCRIDNLVQIAHNVHLGPYCVIVAQVGIAGSTVLGAGTMMGGQAGIGDHVTIGKGVKIAAQAGVMRDIADNETVGGSPAVPIKKWHRQTLLLDRMTRNNSKEI